MIDKLKEKYPDIIITDNGTKFVPFRGGDSLAKGSHYWVKFKFPE